MVDGSGQIAKKYDNAKLAIALILGAVEELERKSKGIYKIPKNEPKERGTKCEII